MYNVVRKIHLYTGMVILIFLMMYFASGYIMAHRPWFVPPSPPPSTRTVALDADASRSPRQIAANVKKELVLPGRIQFPQKQPADETLFWTVRPGSMIRVDVVPRNHIVRLTTQRVGWIQTLIMLHKVAGYDNEPLFDLCALFSDLAGLSMILFAFTGVYLWWKRVKNHALGIAFLVASCAYAIGMMLYFAYAR
jgi:hypothetical protein